MNLPQIVKSQEYNQGGYLDHFPSSHQFHTFIHASLKGLQVYFLKLIDSEGWDGAERRIEGEGKSGFMAKFRSSARTPTRVTLRHKELKDTQN